MSSAIEELTGVRENTTTASVGSGPIVAQFPLVSKNSAGKPSQKFGGRRRLKIRRTESLVEDDFSTEKSVIPQGAEKISTSEIQPGKVQVSSSEEFSEPLISTTVALVAPDATPNAEIPLDPAQVPAGLVQPQVTAEVPSPEVPAANGRTDALSVIIGNHQEKFNPALLSGKPVDVNSLVEGTLASITGKPASSASAATKAAKILAEAHSGKVPDHVYNPEAGVKASAAMRMVFGD